MQHIRTFIERRAAAAARGSRDAARSLGLLIRESSVIFDASADWAYQLSRTLVFLGNEPSAPAHVS